MAKRHHTTHRTQSTVPRVIQRPPQTVSQPLESSGGERAEESRKGPAWVYPLVFAAPDEARAEIEERLVTVETRRVIQHTHLSGRVVRAMDLGELFHWSVSSVNDPIEDIQIG